MLLWVVRSEIAELSFVVVLSVPCVQSSFEDWLPSSEMLSSMYYVLSNNAGKQNTNNFNSLHVFTWTAPILS